MMSWVSSAWTYFLDHIGDLRTLSLIVNCVLIGLWVFRRINMHQFLQGRWEGALERVGTDHLSYEVKMFITDHRDQASSGVIYYTVRDLNTNQTYCSGLDKLLVYKSNLLFCLNHVWEPTFIRLFHAVHESAGSGKIYLQPQKYHYRCRVISWLRRPSMEIAGTVDGNIVRGHLDKT